MVRWTAAAVTDCSAVQLLVVNHSVAQILVVDHSAQRMLFTVCAVPIRAVPSWNGKVNQNNALQHGWTPVVWGEDHHRKYILVKRNSRLVVVVIQITYVSYVALRMSIKAYV